MDVASSFSLTVRFTKTKLIFNFIYKFFSFFKFSEAKNSKLPLMVGG